MILACRNGNCIAYKEDSCRRALRHKEAIQLREKFTEYITPRNNENKCELHLPKDKK